MPDNKETTGEFIIRTSFLGIDNPRGVDIWKQKFAKLINEIEAIPEKEDWSPRQKQSLARLKARAFTFIEDASGVVVKAVTIV